MFQKGQRLITLLIDFIIAFFTSPKPLASVVHGDLKQQPLTNKTQLQ